MTEEQYFIELIKDYNIEICVPDKRTRWYHHFVIKNTNGCFFIKSVSLNWDGTEHHIKVSHKNIIAPIRKKCSVSTFQAKKIVRKIMKKYFNIETRVISVH